MSSESPGRGGSGRQVRPGRGLLSVGILALAFACCLAPGPASASGATLFVNKYGPGESSTPGCATAPYTAIGSVDGSFGAVGAAASGDIIFICGSPDAATDPVTPTTGPYTPNVFLGTKSLTFVGDGSAKTILDGEGSPFGRTLFFTDSYLAGQPGYLNLEAMTVRNGFDINNGGGVEVLCRDMDISNVHFTDNKAIGFGQGGGGGISLQDIPDCPGMSDITVNSSVFTGNITEYDWSDQNGVDGGAIRTTGTASISSSTFASNEAKASINSTRASRGGAIWAEQGISVTDSTFTGNSTTRGSGGALSSSQGSVTVAGGDFSENVANSGASGAVGAARGGAILAAGTITVTDSDFEENSAIAPTGMAGGGAISAGSRVELTDSSFLGNSVDGDDSVGGAVFAGVGGAPSIIDGSIFANNSAPDPGSFAGAVRASSPGLEVTNSTFTGNQAPDVPAVSSSDSLTLVNVTSSGNSGRSDLYAGGNLRIGNSIIDETGEACTAAGAKINDGGNVIATTTEIDCDPFLGTGGAPAGRVTSSAIALQPLADNGGPTKTMALGLTSVARTSAAVNLLSPNPTDQRGFARPLTNQSSGAYQLTGPENTAIPRISGTAQVDQTLTASTGSWRASPPVTGYSYQWQRCEVSSSPDFLGKWGGFGSGSGQFINPQWIGTDSNGNVFVSDRGNGSGPTPDNRIQKFDAAGNFLGRWGSEGNGAGQFRNIGGIAVGPGGEVYVSDSGNNRVQKFTNDGVYLGQWGSSGTGDGKFNSPGPLATDSAGNVYVTDYNNQRVQKFTSSGAYLTQWGSYGSSPGQFTSPGSIAVDSSGNVYVVDIYSWRVEKFTSSGTFLTQWGSRGSGNGQFEFPTGIAIDSAGTVYVANGNTPARIQAFSPSGSYLFQWGADGTDPGEMDDPYGLSFGAGGDLYEVDAGNNRIQRFATLDCTDISGGTNPTYRQAPADQGKTIRVKVTATDGVAPTGQALSAPTAPVAPSSPSTYVLSVAKSVADTGKGTVTSTPSGINCGPTCQKTYDPGTRVTLTATPDLGSRFTGWTGACTNRQGPCEVTMNYTQVVTARFTAVDTYRLTVSKQGTGQGTVSSSPSGIDCGTTCESQFNDGEEVTLIASAAQGSTFTGWSGACTGTDPCQVTMDQARQVAATFTEDPPPPPPPLVSDVGIELNTPRPATVPSSRVLGAVRVSCEGDAPCRIESASATARARKVSARNAPVSFQSGAFPAGTSRVVQVTIPTSVYNDLRRGRKSGLLTVNVRAQGTEGPRDRSLRAGLQR